MFSEARPACGRHDVSAFASGIVAFFSHGIVRARTYQAHRPFSDAGAAEASVGWDFRLLARVRLLIFQCFPAIFGALPLLLSFHYLQSVETGVRGVTGLVYTHARETVSWCLTLRMEGLEMTL